MPIKYKACFLLGLQRSMQYRFDFSAGLVGVVFTIGIQFFLWTAIFHGTEKPTLYGYRYSQMVLYMVLAAITSRLVATGFERDIAEDIRNGGLTKYLVQPIHYLWYVILRFFGDKVVPTVMFCVIAAGVGIGLKFAIGLPLPLDWVAVLRYGIVTALALVLNCLISVNVSMIAFWLAETSAFFALTGGLASLVSGGVLPLNVFGSVVTRCSQFLPFEYTVYFPVNVATGRVSTPMVVQGMTAQIIWILVLCALVVVLWRTGLKKYIAVGG